jgi:hypothetical protein
MEWQQEDSTVATAELGEVDAGRLRYATDLGLKLYDDSLLLTENLGTGTCEEIDPSITTVTVTNKFVTIH